MKRGTPHHPKMLMLSAAIKRIGREAGDQTLAALSHVVSVGIMEMIWQWASRYAIQGDIGKWPNDVIAEAVQWKHDPDQLIEAIISSGWLDRVEEPARLVIHDLQDHADNTWRQNLLDSGLTWWDGTPPRKDRVGRPKANSSETPEELKKNSRKTPQPEPEPEPKPEPAAARPPGPARACVREAAAAALSDALHRATPSEPKPPGPKILKRITEAMGDMPAEDVVANLRDFARRRASPKGYGFWPDVVSDWAKTHATKPPICPKCRGDGVIYLPVPEDATTADIDAGKYQAPCDCKKLTAGATA